MAVGILKAHRNKVFFITTEDQLQDFLNAMASKEPWQVSGSCVFVDAKLQEDSRTTTSKLISRIVTFSHKGDFDIVFIIRPNTRISRPLALAQTHTMLITVKGKGQFNV